MIFGRINWHLTLTLICLLINIIIVAYLILKSRMITGVQSIKNGLYAEPGDFPYVVAIRNFNSYHCSGVLINDFNVLTVGHTVDVVSTHLELTVAVGEVMLAHTVKGRHDACLVKAVYLHPQFAKSISEGGDESFVNDVAVLQTKLPMHAFVGPASLMNAEPSWGLTTDCSIISWSRTSMGYMKLMWDKVKYVSDEDSQSWGTNLPESQTGFNDLWEQEFISTDDIGSPIVCNNQVIGLTVKEGEHDQVQKPSTLLFIYNYLHFIWEIMNEGLFDVHPLEFPYAATIWNLAVPECGGFIVDETHIVTTGYCTRRINSMNGGVTVGYKTIDVHDSHTNWLKIKDIVKHPNYNAKQGSWPIYESPNDIAVITLTEPLVWSPTISPVMMEQSNNFAAGQVCQVLRWVPTPKNNLMVVRLLTLKRSLVVIWNEKELECLVEAQEETSFWGRTQYVMPIVKQIDGGNPIICGNYPVGMVLQDSKPRNWDGPKSARFLKIRPFIDFINNVTRRT